LPYVLAFAIVPYAYGLGYIDNNFSRPRREAQSIANIQATQKYFRELEQGIHKWYDITNYPYPPLPLKWW